jgi:hypothetical protein
MAKFAKIEGNPGLVRDKVTGAILNINSNEIKQAKKRKKFWQEEKEKTETLMSEVDSLKHDVREMKDLLKQILEVANGTHHN